jgi:hypothetical protein
MAYRIEYVKDTAQEHKEEFENAFKQARIEATQQKDTIESEWFSVYGKQKLDNESWYKDHHASAGHLIGQHRRLVVVMQNLIKDERYTATRSGSTWDVSLGEKPLCKVSAFVPTVEDTVVVEGAVRPVYKINNKEYVVDDDNIPTRRFGYCVRPPNEEGNAPVLKVIELEKMGNPTPRRGKVVFKAGPSREAMGRALDALTGQDRSEWHQLDIPAKVCLAYLNYAYDGCAGVCLSSTPKRIRDNKGKALLDDEGFRVWKVDLAKIPSSKVLINIYARDLPDEKPTQWIAQGTLKNREVFCSEVPSTATTSMNATAAMLEEANWSWKNMEFFTG